MDATRFAALVIRRWWLVLVLGVAAAILAYAVSSVLPKQYQAEARVLVGSITDPSIDSINAYQQLAQTYADLATSSPVLTSVASQLNRSDSPRALAADISARAPLGESIVRIVATQSTPDAAQALADAVAKQLVTLSTPPNSSKALVSVIQPALPPDGPSSPLLALNTLVGAILGVLLGVAMAVMLGLQEQPETRTA